VLVEVVLPTDVLVTGYVDVNVLNVNVAELVVVTVIRYVEV